jgi:hypothetical protein
LQFYMRSRFLQLLLVVILIHPNLAVKIEFESTNSIKG